MPLVGPATDDAAISSFSSSGSGSTVSGATGASPSITDPPTTVPPDAVTTQGWGCAEPRRDPAAAGEPSSGGGPATTTTVVGVGTGDAGGSGSSGPGCPGSVCPAPPCPPDAACAYACSVPPCDPAACSDPYPGPTVVADPPIDPIDPPADLPSTPTGAIVTVTSVEVVLAAVPGSDGALWFVPAYRLTGDDGSAVTVLAIDESFVAPSSGATGSSATVGTEIAPLPEPAPEPATDPTQVPAPAPASGTGVTPCTAPWMC